MRLKKPSVQADTSKDLEYDTISVNKAAAEADASFESSTVDKMLSDSPVGYREIAHERVT